MENLMVISAEILITGLAVGFFCLLLLGLYTVFSAMVSDKKLWDHQAAKQSQNVIL